MADAVNIGGIYADLDLNTGNLDQGLAKGRQAMEAVAQEVRTLQANFKAGAISAQDLAARTAELNQVMAELKSRMEAAYSAVGVTGNGLGVLNAGMTRAAGGSRDLGRSVLLASQGLEDLQYGIGAVLNNIPMLVMSLGGTAGLAGVISVVAVGSKVLYDHWDDLMGLFGSGKPKSEAEEMAELAKQTRLTADEAERLARFKALEGKTAELRGAKTESQAKSEDTATKAIVEADIKRVRQGVIKNAPEMLEGDDGVQKARKALKDAEGLSTTRSLGRGEVATNDPGMIEAKREAVAAARKAIPDAIRAAADKLAANDVLTKFGPNGPGQLADIVARDPAAFGPHAGVLQGELRKAQQQADVTPEERAAKEADKAWDKDAEGVAEHDKKARAEAAKLDKFYQDDARQADEFDRKERAKAKRARQEERGRDRDTAKERDDLAHKLNPGLDRDVETNIGMARLGGVPMDQIGKDIEAALVKSGMSDGKIPDGRGGFVQAGENDAKAEAKKLLAEGDERLNDRVARSGQNRKSEAVRNSETFDTAGLTARAQSAVKSGVESESKKHTTLLGEVVHKLSKMADRKTIEIEVKD